MSVGKQVNKTVVYNYKLLCSLLLKKNTQSYFCGYYEKKHYFFICSVDYKDSYFTKDLCCSTFMQTKRLRIPRSKVIYFWM